MPFGLKNAPAIFSKAVIIVFMKFIHKFLKVYFNDGTVFGLMDKHVGTLTLMLAKCQEHQISLNLKKKYLLCSFWHFIGTRGVQTRTDGGSVKQLRTMLGHTRCYGKFIKGYAQITVEMEKLLKRDAKYEWSEEC